jgi:hypothetical protein
MILSLFVEEDSEGLELTCDGDGDGEGDGDDDDDDGDDDDGDDDGNGGPVLIGTVSVSHVTAVVLQVGTVRISI